MIRRLVHVELKRLQILSRSQKCCRFKASQASLDNLIQVNPLSLGNIDKKKLSRKTNQTWLDCMVDKEQAADGS